MAKLPAKFSLTIPSEAAKKAKTREMKWRSLLVKLSQCLRSSAKSTSSTVQKLAMACLYIAHSYCSVMSEKGFDSYWNKSHCLVLTSSSLIGYNTNLFGFSLSNGSSSNSTAL